MKSESIKNLAEALSKAQSEFKAVPFNAVNGFLKNKYADLGAIIESTKPVLTSNGLSVSQFPISVDEKIGVTTILMHSSGEWIENTISMSVGEERGKSAAQAAGSIITYLRRYSLASALGIYSDEDDDGQPATGKPANRPAAVSRPATNTSKPAAELGGVVKTEVLRITPEKLKEFIAKKANGVHKSQTCSKEQRGLLVGMLNEIFQNSNEANQESDRKEFCNWLVGFASTKDIPDNFVLSMLDWIAAEKDSGGAYCPSVDAVKEAHAALVVAREEAGQMAIL